MSHSIPHIRMSLSTKLSTGILVFVILGFLVSLGVLFQQSRKLVKEEAIAHAENILDHTTQRVAGYLKEVEKATNDMEGVVLQNMKPDSLMKYVHQIVAQNPNFNGCSITTEPYYFPQFGRYFSVYSVRSGDSISTVREAEYEYFEKVWYKSPRLAEEAVWVDPFDDFNEGTLSSEEMIASYCKPLYTPDHRFIGVLSTDLSLPRLSKAISAKKPYEHSYCMMLGKDGHYFVHPDTTKLFTKTIFSDIDPTQHADIITLGYEMTAGKQGVLEVNIDGNECYVFYRPLPNTPWSVALVCTESDVFSDYNRLAYIVIPLLVAGLLFILLFCKKTVRHFINPLDQLVEQAHRIADGHFNEHMPLSNRTDVIGHLQNNFVAMQQTLDEHVGNIKHINVETQKRNEELISANQLAQEANRKKTAFLQDMSHQIRTPLNIIQGFVQVLRDDYQIIPQEEITNITNTMRQNAIAVTRMVDMLIAASALENGNSIEKKDKVNCKEFIQTIAENYHHHPPLTTQLVIDNKVEDTLTIQTNRDYLTKALNELLYNAKKFAAGDGSTTKGYVTLRIKNSLQWLQFQVEDKGPGIAETDRDLIFQQFTKLNEFSEGLGLGLTIARQFALLLGGSLSLDTTYTDGSRFILRIPIA